uniref:CSON005638 protein n=2 Tax=Culicoides sonorensis TaxID=179676 RepID=A0A336K206_CULSO
MYHEAKKYEKKMKEILVDYRKRAERRQIFYQRIKADPTQFLQIHGRKCKIHIDTASGIPDIGTMMKWNNEVVIDRFDARAHLDYIPQVLTKDNFGENKNEQDLSLEDRQLNYERFRILILNEFLSLKEQEFLTQLDELHELNTQNDLKKRKKKQSSSSGVSIGYTYNSDEIASQSFSQTIMSVQTKSLSNRYDELAKDSSDSDIDFDLPIDINKVSTVDANELNALGRRYGMMSNDFFSFITHDIDELQALKETKKEETSKTNRTGRRERREIREKKMRPGSFSFPSYAKTEIENNINQEEDDDSDSNTDCPGKITYITSFGNEEPKRNEDNVHNRKPLYSDKLKENLKKFKKIDRRSKSSKRYSFSSSESSSSTEHYRKRRPKKSYRNRSSSQSSRSPSKEKKLSNRYSPNKIESSEEQRTTDPPIKRYYGRNRKYSDSSELSCDEKHDLEKTYISNTIKASFGGKPSSNVKVNKEDKKIETMKKLQQIEEQKEREVEIKQLALKLRKRQRELRHQFSSSEHEERHSPISIKVKRKIRSSSSSSSSSSSENLRKRTSRNEYKTEAAQSSRKNSPESWAYNKRNNDHKRKHSRSSKEKDRHSPLRQRGDGIDYKRSYHRSRK